MSSLLSRFTKDSWVSGVLLGVCAVSLSLCGNNSVQAADPVRVLIVDGQNNHNWKATTPILKDFLVKSGRFTVDVATTPVNKQPASAWIGDRSRGEQCVSRMDRVQQDDRIGLARCEVRRPADDRRQGPGCSHSKGRRTWSRSRFAARVRGHRTRTGASRHEGNSGRMDACEGRAIPRAARSRRRDECPRHGSRRQADRRDGRSRTHGLVDSLRKRGRFHDLDGSRGLLDAVRRLSNDREPRHRMGRDQQGHDSGSSSISDGERHVVGACGSMRFIPCAAQCERFPCGAA